MGAREPGRTAGGLHMRPCLLEVNAGCLRGSVAWSSGLELDLDEYELETVGVDDVVLDPDLAGVGDTGPKRCRHRRLAVEDGEFARCNGHHDIVVHVLVPAGVSARREAPFSDDHA